MSITRLLQSKSNNHQSDNKSIHFRKEGKNCFLIISIVTGSLLTGSESPKFLIPLLVPLMIQRSNDDRWHVSPLPVCMPISSLWRWMSYWQRVNLSGCQDMSIRPDSQEWCLPEKFIVRRGVREFIMLTSNPADGGYGERDLSHQGKDWTQTLCAEMEFGL